MNPQLESEIIYLLETHLQRIFSSQLEKLLNEERKKCMVHQMLGSTDSIKNVIRCPEILDTHLKFHENENKRFWRLFSAVISTSSIIIALLSYLLKHATS